MSEREEDQATEENAQTEPDGGDETEERARATGWVPKEEFHGHPEDWVPADEWVSFTPAKLRKQNRALERQIDAMKKSLDVVSKRQEEMRDKAYKDALREIRKRQKAAAADGDMEEYEKLEEEREKLEPPQPKKEEKEAPIDPVLTQWAEQNQWIVSDEVNFTEARALAQRYHRQYPASSLAERLEMVTAEMNRRYGSPGGNGKDETTRTRRPPMAESNTRGTNRGGGKKTVGFADLTTEEKEAVYELERRGQIGKGEDALFKTRDEYAKHLRDYYGEA